MDFITTIIKIQNLKLLEIMAKDNFTQGKDQKIFIEKYNKINYHLLQLVKEDIYLSYEKRINNLITK